MVLLFAWSLGEVCRDLHTAEYLTTSLSGVLSPRLLPVITFLLACGILRIDCGDALVLSAPLAEIGEELGLASRVKRFLGCVEHRLHLLFRRALAAEALNLDSPEAIQALVRERVPAANLD